MDKEHHGFLWGVLAAFTSSGMGLFVKLADQVPVTTLVFIRFLLALPIIAVFFLRKKVKFTWKNLPKHLTRSLAGLSSLYCFYIALKYLDLVNAVTLRSTAPLFMPILAFFWLKVIVSKRRVIALIIGFFGVLILLQPSGHSLNFVSLVAVISALLGAIAMFSIRQLSMTESTEEILCYYFSICTVLACIPMIIGYEPIKEPLQWIYLIAAGLCALVFQYTITKAYTHAPATKVSSVNYLGVFFGGLYGWLFFNEVPSIWIWLGVSLIIVGALFALTDRTKARRFRG